MVNIYKYSSEVRKWNQLRDNTTFSEELELNMLGEEYKEYLAATTITDRFDALCDYVFVYLGTLSKIDWNVMEYDTLEEYFKVKDGFKQYAETMIDIMIWELMVDCFNSAEEFEQVFETCMRYVINANNKKGTEKNAEGKIQKGKDWVDPKHDIKNYLMSRGVC